MVVIIILLPQIKHKGKKLNVSMSDRLDLLVKTIKNELVKDYNKFNVKLIQLYYNDDYEKYKRIKRENITKRVSI